MNCQKCNSSNNVSYWAYEDDAGYESSGAGFYCGKCGSKPYVITIGIMLTILVICVIGSIL